MIKAGITGLIGSGKSVVASIFETIGIPVYNADAQAKILMCSNPEIITALTNKFGTEAYINGTLNKAFIAEIIFNDEASRIFVNSVVHPEVDTNFINWTQNQNSAIVAIESALLFEANIQNILDYTISVKSDTKISARRISDRDKISIEEALKRINVQLKKQSKNNIPDFIILNNESDSLILQSLEIIEKIKSNGKTR
jgi:dephospho-CoA kinase